MDGRRCQAARCARGATLWDDLLVKYEAYERALGDKTTPVLLTFGPLRRAITAYIAHVRACC